MSFRRLLAFMLFASTLFCFSAASAASRERVLHNFAGAPTDCANPDVRVIADAKGNLFGTTISGGAYNLGCVFKISQQSDGSWTETVIYNFSGPDGSSPAASLIFDAAGNLYGTTAGGGDLSVGIVFELTPSTGGAWTETILHTFGSGTDGYDPQAELVFDAAGNLYGTTQFGGTKAGFDNGGTVYRLSPSSGGWTETLLYSFPGSYFGPDGDLPAGSVVMDSQGNLYGVAQAGGANGAGAIYELSPQADGSYAESIIHSFETTDGQDPNSTLVMDSAGNLYGTTLAGGDTQACPPNGCGTVFELKKNPNLSWALTVLHALNKNKDGWEGAGPVAFDAAGNLYAAATAGGAYSAGSIFKLMPSAHAPWPETVIHAFTGGSDGGSPNSGVIVNSGRLFGTAANGGSSGQGIVFELRN
jgi:uncharacterized repeat protein (TIGR03803 family)